MPCKQCCGKALYSYKRAVRVLSKKEYEVRESISITSDCGYSYVSSGHYRRELVKAMEETVEEEIE